MKFNKQAHKQFRACPSPLALPPPQQPPTRAHTHACAYTHMQTARTRSHPTHSPTHPTHTHPPTHPHPTQPPPHTLSAHMRGCLHPEVTTSLQHCLSYQACSIVHHAPVLGGRHAILQGGVQVISCLYTLPICWHTVKRPLQRLTAPAVRIKNGGQPKRQRMQLLLLRLVRNHMQVPVRVLACIPVN